MAAIPKFYPTKIICFMLKIFWGKLQTLSGSTAHKMMLHLIELLFYLQVDQIYRNLQKIHNKILNVATFLKQNFKCCYIFRILSNKKVTRKMIQNSWPSPHQESNSYQVCQSWSRDM